MNKCLNATGRGRLQRRVKAWLANAKPGDQLTREDLDISSSSAMTTFPYFVKNGLLRVVQLGGNYSEQRQCTLFAKV